MRGETTSIDTGIDGARLFPGDTSIACPALLAALLLLAGCSQPVADDSAPPAVSDPTAPAPEPTPPVFEFSAEDLLASRLPQEQASAGWIRLFDGNTLYGWEIAGRADWRVEEGTIVVESGDRSLLCTSLPWQNFELKVEFLAGPKTNSGIFLRTPLKPTDPATDCYEVNIAPDDNPCPTAGVVKRQNAELAAPQSFGDWKEMTMKLEGNQLQVWLNDELVCDYTDPLGLPPGRIGLQHNSGRVAFRNIRLRPIGLQSLLDQELSKWKRYPQMPGQFSVTDDGWLHVEGGRTQLETNEQFDDFVLLAEYKLPSSEMNSGIFFRCIPGDEMMGYECQLSNQMKDDMPLQPADCGTGGIFRRQDARIIAGETDAWVTVVLVAHGPNLAAWVNGLQVSDFVDTRAADENPRRGLRLEAGTIMIQGHDPGTDALLKQIKIAPIAVPE